jgi:hypothetical protein
MLTDRTSLRDLLIANGYAPPPDTMIFATQIIDGLGQPAFIHYSLDDTAFLHSHRQFWPASMIKIWAAVGALITLNSFGLDSQTQLMFADNYGPFQGNAADLFRQLNNTSYDRLMLIAGMAQINNPKLRERFGLKQLILQCGYGKSSDISLSPPIQFRHRHKRRWRRGTIPERKSKSRFQECPAKTNCTNFSEIQDVLRRIMLHEQLPAAERFPVADSDMVLLRRALRRRKHKIWMAAEQVLGSKTKAYGKSGSSSGGSQMENVMLLSPNGQFLLTLGTPWYREDPDAAPSMIELEELGKHLLQVLLKQQERGVPLQMPHGQALDLKLNPSSKNNPQLFQLHIKAPHIDQLRAWINTESITFQISKDHTFQAQYAFNKSGRYIITLQAMQKHKIISYQYVTIDIAQN